eukprot:NODE_1634_length_1464_cov_27.002120_g1476_i0.p1 GENE.NODE_1634_length_1464_cov_27.002120_g1476_i0~~NODE_1634_length_1464_cov_27.002120_g1476_i0.p1  ORF type:complete len:390 (-),score=31.26 NODE_1634_length_1464_cov_27.002120_g1476_i0:158-1327(-)
MGERFMSTEAQPRVQDCLLETISQLENDLRAAMGFIATIPRASSSPRGRVQSRSTYIVRMRRPMEARLRNEPMGGIGSDPESDIPTVDAPPASQLRRCQEVLRQLVDENRKLQERNEEINEQLHLARDANKDLLRRLEERRKSTGSPAYVADLHPEIRLPAASAANTASASGGAEDPTQMTTSGVLNSGICKIPRAQDCTGEESRTTRAPNNVSEREPVAAFPAPSACSTSSTFHDQLACCVGFLPQFSSDTPRGNCSSFQEFPRRSSCLKSSQSPSSPGPPSFHSVHSGLGSPSSSSSTWAVQQDGAHRITTPRPRRFEPLSASPPLRKLSFGSDGQPMGSEYLAGMPCSSDGLLGVGPPVLTILATPVDSSSGLSQQVAWLDYDVTK